MIPAACRKNGLEESVASAPNPAANAFPRATAAAECSAPATGFQIIGSGQPATSRGSNTHTLPLPVRASTMASRSSGFVEVVMSGPGASSAAPTIR